MLHYVSKLRFCGEDPDAITSWSVSTSVNHLKADKHSGRDQVWVYINLYGVFREVLPFRTFECLGELVRQGVLDSLCPCLDKQPNQISKPTQTSNPVILNPPSLD